MTACPLCTSAAARELQLPHSVIWKCRARDCGLEFASPQLKDDDLARAYSTFYYPGSANSHAFQREGTPDSVLRQILSQLSGSLGALNGLQLLDYGCGRGQLSQIAAEFGLAPFGIEPAPLARSVAAQQVKMPVYASLADLSAKHPAARFDLIILWNVIEHLRRPWSELQKMRALMHPRSWLLLCTMNTGCLRARIERGSWMSYGDPTHFYYFSRSSLARVLRSGGFQHVQEWRPKIRYPHHGALRRCFYQISTAFGVSDGLYYLCSAEARCAPELQSRSPNEL
jgi:2-polyprenyl-3-methyl-5-hydroxy-6-metoxy-1,4-benzoquinol methylase